MKKNVIRYGLGAALAGALALGTAQAQSSQGDPGKADAGTGSGSPNSVGAGDTSRTGDSPSTGSGSSSSGTSSGMSGSTGAADTATGGGATAGSSSTASGTPSAGKKVDKKVTDSLEKLHAGNQAEIQLAQTAQQNAQSPDVKQFAQQMQTDHQQMDEQLTSSAQTAGVTSLEGKTFQKETQSSQKDMQKLTSKTGQDFDKAYMSQMVKDHEKELKEVKGAVKDAQKGDQTELASTLQDAQTKIQSHLDHAKQIQKSLGKGGGTASSSSGSNSMGTGSSSSGSSDTSKVHSGSRGDTGGPTPGGADRGSSTGTGSTVTPHGGEQGTSSDSGTREKEK